MLKLTTKTCIDVDDWDRFVEQIYGRPYAFQQQDGCKPRGIVNFTAHSTVEESDVSWVEEEAHDSVAEMVNGSDMCVKFAVWLARNPKDPIPNQQYDWELEMFWHRNFYPPLDSVVQDLVSKGLLAPGEYTIIIDW